MSPDLFILTISVYLISIVSSLVASFFYKLIPLRLNNVIVIFHFLALIVWIILPGSDNSLITPGNSNYFFLIYFCSGILVAGVVLRNNYAIAMKFYFGLLLASIVVFIVAPSRMLGFIASGKIKAYDPERIHITENYFLVEQNETSSIPHPDSSYFKLIREMGMFHKTIRRDIAIPAKYDSMNIDIKKVHLFHLKIYQNGNYHLLELNLPESP